MSRKPQEPLSAEAMRRMEQLIEAAGYSDDEALYLFTHKARGVPHRQVGDVLGWDSTKVERIRKRIARASKAHSDAATYRRRLETAYDDSRSTYREVLPSGRRVWSMVPHGPVFVEVMTQERPQVVNCPQTPISRRRFFMNSPETKLTEARSVASRLWMTQARLEDELTAAERDLQLARRAQGDDEELALIEGRSPKAALAKKVLDAEARLEDLSRKVDATKRAVARQDAAIAEIQGEINAGRHEKYLAEIAGPAADVRAAVETLAVAVLKVHGIFSRYDLAGSGSGLEDVFPHTDRACADGWEQQLGMYGATMRLLHARGGMYGTLPGNLGPEPVAEAV